ncbi:MAG: hypothetical protein GY729_15380, partial [Desulfobacteraceae bacterium]|nr:hypothetical protein [Desulfobacteraceae bacterium]
ILKEIVDSEAGMEGTFEMTKGRLFSSTVFAKGGMEVEDIGSEKTKPASIFVGTSYYLKNELENISEVIERRQHILEFKTMEKNKLENKLKNILDKLGKATLTRHESFAIINEVESKEDQISYKRLAELQKKLDDADKETHELKDQKNLCQLKLKKLENEILNSSNAVKQSVKEKFHLKRLDEKNRPKPILKATGRVVSGTRISGQYASKILSESISNIKIMEVNNSEDSSRQIWEMAITEL